MWLLAMCVTASTVTPVYAVEPVAEQSPVEENAGNEEENQEQENKEENSDVENALENSGENSGEEKAPENSGENSGEVKEPENSGENSGEEKEQENSGENSDEEEKADEVSDVSEDELALQELEEENQIVTFSDEEIKTVTDLDGLLDALNHTTCQEIQVTGTITVNRTVTISGKTSGVTLVRKDYKGNLFQVEKGGELTLTNITIDGQKNIYRDCNPLICIDEGGTLTLEKDAVLQNNHSKLVGSAIQTSSGSLTMNGGSIQDNETAYNGGGIYLGQSATFKMTGGTIQGNTGDGGGGIDALCQVTMTGGTIENNTANHGGGITLNGTGVGLVMSGGSITGNHAEANSSNSDGKGGGVYVHSGATLTLSNGAVIDNNKTDGYGGGIYSEGTININGGTITNNTSFQNGGGIFNQGIVIMSDGKISGNKSTNGSGGGIFSPAILRMSGGSITGNTANSNGGGIYQGGNFEVQRNVQITDNKLDVGKASNVFLDCPTSGNYSCYVEIAFEGLSGNSKIGVSMETRKVLNITPAINDADYSEYFTSDDSNYKVIDVVGNDGKHQLSLEKIANGGGNTGGNTGGGESGGSTGGNTGGSESGGTTGGNNSGNTSSNTETSSGTSGGGSSASTVASTPVVAPKETTITVPLQASSQKSTVETGNLPTNLQQRVLNQKIAHTVLSSAETGVKVGLDIEAVRSISGQAQGDASVVVQKLDSATLKGNAAAVIGTRPVVTVQVQDAAGKTITNLGAGSVLVEIPYVLQNGENPGNICAVSTDANGNVQWILNSVYDSEKQVLRFRTLQGADYGVASIPVGIYKDTVGTDKQADIAFAVSRGLLTGDAKGETFAPEKAVTMEEFANALDRMTGKKVSDVVLGSFAPDQSITREEMAVLLVKYADTLGIVLPKMETATAFADQNQISAQAQSAVQKLQQAGVLNGKTAQTFAPGETMTRADFCTTLRLFLEMMVRGTCRTE